MKKIAYAVLAVLSMHAYADVQTSINQLQSEINTLNVQLQKKANDKAIAPSIIGLDSSNPLALMPKVQMPVYVLRAKDQLSQPIVFGALLEADAQYTSGDTITMKGGSTYGSGSDTAMSKVQPFVMSNINSMTTGIFSIKNSLPITNPVVIDRAFVIFGNLDKSPFSLTTGMTYLPFGTFSGNGPWNNALTTNLFRTAATNQIDVNYSNAWLIGNAGIFNSDASGAPADTDLLVNAIAKKTWRNIGVSLGAGYLSDVRGLNSGLGEAYTFSSTGTASQPLTGGTNPAYDINASIGPAYFTLLGEYASTIHGAQSLGQNVGLMNAWMLGEQSTFKSYGIPFTFQISYSATDNMNNVPMPFAGAIAMNLKTATGIKNQWLTSIDGEFWKNIYIGPEFDYQHLYTGQNSLTSTLDVSVFL